MIHYLSQSFFYVNLLISLLVLYSYFYDPYDFGPLTRTLCKTLSIAKMYSYL